MISKSCDQPCCWVPDEDEEDECEHHFVKLNDSQIFCESCGEIRGNGTTTECGHNCFHYCSCNHWQYPTYPTWTWTSPNTPTIYSTGDSSNSMGNNFTLKY